MAQQKIEIKINKSLKPSERLELADLVIEHIVDRTQRGLDKNGKKFPRYSKEYMESLDFKNARKTGSVDLQLSGDMLAALDLLRQKNGSLTIGFQRGTGENARAEGNILGSYGKLPNPSLARDFLGIKSAKLRELVRFVKEKNDSE